MDPTTGEHRPEESPAPIGGRRVVGGVLSFAASALASKLIAAVAFAVIARSVGAREFGLVAVAAAFALALESWVGQGMGDFVVSHPRLERAHLDTAFWINIVAGGLVAGALSVAAPVLEAWTGTPDTTPLIRWLSVGLIFHGATVVPAALLLREGRFKAAAARNAAATAIAAAAGMGAALGGAGRWALVIQSLVSDVVGLLVLAGAVRFWPRPVGTWRHARELWSYGGNMLGVSVVNALAQRVTMAIVGGWTSATSAGFYAVAQRVQQIATQLLIKPVDTVALPTLARLRDDPTVASEMFVRTASLAAAVAWPAFAGLALVASDALVVVLGDGWAAAAGPLVAFSVLGSARVVSYLTGATLRAGGRPYLVLRVVLIEAVVLVGGLAVAKGAGVTALAWASAVASVAVLPLYLWLVRVHARIDLARLALLLTPIAASLGFMAVAVWLLRTELGASEPATRLVAASAAGVVTYLTALAVLARGSLREAMEVARGRRRTAA
ncbi:MAG: oligosaccharide flippase family protein [Polyangiaceae bacterium]|nr:oligosaccharide flippase family protein [Polyangiaceae bacterium]